MADALPYVNSTGLLKTMLQKIKDAQTPQRFTHDYLTTELGISERAMIPLLKKLKLLNDDGTPTQLYRDFRNPDTSGPAMAQAIKEGFAPMYRKNEYAHSLPKDKLTNLIAETMGRDHDAKSVKVTKTTFDTLRAEADFDSALKQSDVPQGEKTIVKFSPKANGASVESPVAPVRLNLGYTINLNLPETTNIEVFNAIFKSLNEHLLKHE